MDFSGIFLALITTMINKILLLFFFTISSLAADLHLFNNANEFNGDFSRSILSGDLKDGEKIFLLDKSVIYKGQLGSGNTTMILRVYDEAREKEFALRLPHGNTEKRFNTFDGMRFINYTFEGYTDLQESKLTIPKIYDYHKSSYLLVDLVEHDFTLKDFLEKRSSFETAQKNKIIESLKVFARESANYESIGDFHNEQLVYSLDKNKWTLLDWTDNHQLARLPSSPKIFSSLDVEAEIYEILSQEIEDQRRIQQEIDNLELEKLITKLQSLDDHADILNVYKEVKANHLASFFTMLQKDFVNKQLPKFPQGVIKKVELELLFSNLGKFTPYYFSQFTEKIITNISDLETFFVLYQKINMIGLEEDLEDDVAIAISKNIERILRETQSSPETQATIEKLKSQYGLINYKTKEILGNADEYLRTSQTCHSSVMSILQRTN